MSLNNFYNEVRRFIRSPEAEVLVIAGKWGVGKTFVWNKLISEACENREIALDKYAYVSLFGLGGIQDLKAAVIQNTVASDKANSFADFATIKDTFTTATTAWRQGFSIIRSTFTDYAAIMDKVGFFLVGRQIVCIDDLERKSQGLEMRDVLGVISHLRERRGCKIVVLLNDERLAGDEEEFRTQLEKVADATVRFDPTPAESAKIGVTSGSSFATKLTEYCITLGIINIRTIKKIERSAVILENDLKKFDRRIFEKALNSLALFQFSKLEPSEAPSIDFIRNLNPFDSLLAPDNQNLPHPEWRRFLQNYRFEQCDPLDEVIMRGVEQGHFDTESLEVEASKLHEQFHRQDEDNSFSEAWDIYHDSFDNNEDEVVRGISAAILATPRAISPTNLSGSIQLLKELEWDGDISALIQTYVDSREDGRDFWNLAEQPFGSEVADPDVRAAFDAKLATFPETRDPKMILCELGRERGWNPSDLAFLASLDADALYSMFKEARGVERRQIIRGALQFQNVDGTNKHMEALTSSAVEALERIARESPINRRRVRQLSGITIDDLYDDGEHEA